MHNNIRPSTEGSTLEYCCRLARPRGVKTDLELERAEPVEDGRTRLLSDPTLRVPLLGLLLVDLLVPFLASPSQSWNSRSSWLSLWLRLGRLPAVLDARRWPPALGAPFEAAAAPSTANRTTTAKPSRANRRWPILDEDTRLAFNQGRV